MRNGFFLLYFSAVELHELTHLLSSSCPWGKHLPPVLHPQCYGFYLAQYRLLLSQLGPHLSVISLHLRPPHSCSVPEPHDCNRSSFCSSVSLDLKKPQLPFGGRAFCQAKFVCPLSSQQGFSACGEDATKLRTVILMKPKITTKKRFLQFF